MRDSYYRITLDMHDTEPQVQLVCALGDLSRSVHIRLTEDGKPYQMGVRDYGILTAKKPDGTSVTEPVGVGYLTDGTIEYQFSDQIAAAAGVVECALKLYSASGDFIGSPRFTLLVTADALDAATVESSDSFIALTEALEKAESGRKVIVTCRQETLGSQPTQWVVDNVGKTEAAAAQAIHEAVSNGYTVEIFAYVWDGTGSSANTSVRVYRLERSILVTVGHVKEEFRWKGNDWGDTVPYNGEGVILVDGTADTPSITASFASWKLEDLYQTNASLHLTKTMKDTWNAKQDAIADLADIRAGAALGETAYQKPAAGIPSTDMTSAVQASLGKADTAVQPGDLAAVATSGDYADLDNAPTNVSSFTNDAGYLTTQDITGKEDKSNKITAFSSPTDTQYPSAKLVSDSLATKMNNPGNAGTAGQVLTKTANGSEWADAQGYDEFEVTATVTALDATPVTNLSKNALEIHTAYNAGKKVVGRFTYQGVTAECPLTSCFQISSTYIATFLCNFYAAASGLNYTLYVVYQQGETDTGYVLPFLGASDIDYSNTTSGLSATNVKTAIDELAAEKIDEPSGGVAGQYLKKTSSGVAWDTPSGGGGGDAVFVEVTTDARISQATYTGFYGWKLNGVTSTENACCLALYNAAKSGTPCSLLIYTTLNSDNALFLPQGTVYIDSSASYDIAYFTAVIGNYSTSSAIYCIDIYRYKSPEEGAIGDVIEHSMLLSPGSGTAGQVLTKTASGYEWADLPTWNGTVI